MKKKIVISIILVILFNIFIISSYCLAGEADNWISPIQNASAGGTSGIPGSEAVNKVLGIILGVVKVIALGVAIIMLTVLGIKYMSAAPNEKAAIKNQLITFTIGAMLVFGAAEILDFASKAILTALNTR